MIKPRLIEIGDINPSRFKRISEIYKEKGLVPLDANLKGSDLTGSDLRKHNSGTHEIVLGYRFKHSKHIDCPSRFW